MKSHAPKSVPMYPTVEPDVITPGVVTITPTPAASSPFELSGGGDDWDAEGDVITLRSANRTRYNLTFEFSSQGFTFVAPALEISQSNQGAFICQPVQSEGATVSVSFINNVTQPVAYDLGFRIKDPDNNIIPWDPQVAFNPPDEQAVDAHR